MIDACARATADPARLPEVLAALHTTRVLAPVVAIEAGGAGAANGVGRGSPRGRTAGEERSEIAVPLLLADDGSRALLIFSGLESLARWDPSARPSPVTGARAAAVALVEGAEALVLDVAGPQPITLSEPDVRALAQGRGRVVAWEDPLVATAIGRLLDHEPAARTASLEPWVGRDARLVVRADVSAGAALTARLGRALADLPALATGVRGIEVVVVLVT